MGCGAARGVKSPSKVDENATVPADSVSDPPVVSSTWATKTEVASAHGGENAGMTGSKPGQIGSRENEQKLVMSNADDDDDEIEIICEAAPKRQEPSREEALLRQERIANPAANAQEPPDAVEEEKKVEKVPEPLSKAQQEEAAKLAERRKKFDAQRYQRDQAAEQEQPIMFRPMVDYGVQAQVATLPKTVSNYDAEPTYTDVVALNEGGKKTSQQDALGGLPGGIFDDQVFNQAPKAKRNDHDVLDTDEAERLMMEILEDVGDS